MWSNEDQKLVDTPEEVINSINSHWKKTFEREFSPPPNKVADWLRDPPDNFGNTTLGDWIPNREEIEKAIIACDDSAT